MPGQHSLLLAQRAKLTAYALFLRYPLTNTVVKGPSNTENKVFSDSSVTSARAPCGLSGVL